MNKQLKEDLINVLSYFKSGLESIDCEEYEEEPMLKEVTNVLNRVKSNSVLGGVVKCDCGFTERMALDCADKNCKHPKFKK